jgi:hypothetical protein
MRSSSSTLITNPHTIESARSNKVKGTFSINGDSTSMTGFNADSSDKNLIKSNLILIKKERKGSNKLLHKLSAIGLKKNNKILTQINNMTANSVISEKDEKAKSDKNSFVASSSDRTHIQQINTLNNNMSLMNNNKKQLKFFDTSSNTEMTVKPILKKHYIHRMGVNLNLGGQHTPSNPSANNLNKVMKNKNVKFCDGENYVKDEDEELDLVTPKPLAQVFNVESYRNFNIYFGDKDEAEEDDRKKKDKTVCQCSCQIF